MISARLTYGGGDSSHRYACRLVGGQRLDPAGQEAGFQADEALSIFLFALLSLLHEVATHVRKGGRFAALVQPFLRLLRSLAADEGVGAELMQRECPRPNLRLLLIMLERRGEAPRVGGHGVYASQGYNELV